MAPAGSCGRWTPAALMADRVHELEVQQVSDGSLPFDPSTARVALIDACAVVGLDPAEAELVRLGENAVYRLRTPVIARVARSAERRPDSQREVQVARWLADIGIPAIRPLDVVQPIEADGRVVTLWESATDREDYGTTAELGAILRRLHAQEAPTKLALPRLRPFDRVGRRIDTVSGVSGDDRSFLRDRAAQLAAAYDHLVFELPFGVVHGDANVGNLLRDRQDRALLMDLDGFAEGPREWDLIQTAIFYDRFGWHSQSEYRQFVDSYGYDILEWPGYPVLRDTRELLMVTWLMQNVAGSEGSATEFAKRMRSLRAGAVPADWDPL